MAPRLPLLLAALSSTIGLADAQACAPPADLALASRVGPAIVKIQTIGTSECTTNGTGFLVSSDGYLLTAAHVVPRECDGQTIAGELHGSDESYDLEVVQRSSMDVALLRITNAARSFPFLPVVRPVTDAPAYEDRYVVISSFLRDLYRPTATSARIDAVRIRGQPGYWALCAIGANRGRSGSPVLLSDGTAIAVFTQRPSPDEQDRAEVIPIFAVLDLTEFSASPSRFRFVSSPPAVEPEPLQAAASEASVVITGSAIQHFAPRRQRSRSRSHDEAARSALRREPAGVELAGAALARVASAGPPTAPPVSPAGGVEFVASASVGDAAFSLPAQGSDAAPQTTPSELLYELSVVDVARAHRSPFERANRFLVDAAAIVPASSISFAALVSRIRRGAQLRYAESFLRQYEAPPGYRFDKSFLDLQVESLNGADPDFAVLPCSGREVNCFRFSEDGRRLELRYRLFAGPLGDAARGWIRAALLTRLVRDQEEQFRNDQ